MIKILFLLAFFTNSIFAIGQECSYITSVYVQTNLLNDTVIRCRKLQFPINFHLFSNEGGCDGVVFFKNIKLNGKLLQASDYVIYNNYTNGSWQTLNLDLLKNGDRIQFLY